MRAWELRAYPDRGVAKGDAALHHGRHLHPQCREGVGGVGIDESVAPTVSKEQYRLYTASSRARLPPSEQVTALEYATPVRPA